MIALTRGKKWGMLVCHPSPSAILSVQGPRQTGEGQCLQEVCFGGNDDIRPQDTDTSSTIGHADSHVEVIVSPCPPVYAFREARLTPWAGSVCHYRFPPP
jgi:hypothetical protein